MMFAAHYVQAFGEAAHPTATAKMSALGPQVLSEEAHVKLLIGRLANQWTGHKTLVVSRFLGESSRRSRALRNFSRALLNFIRAQLACRRSSRTIQLANSWPDPAIVRQQSVSQAPQSVKVRRISLFRSLQH